MTTIQYEELVKLYGQYAAVVDEAYRSFKLSVNRVLDEIRDAASKAVGTEVKEGGRDYRCWSLDSLESDPLELNWARPYVWIDPTDSRIVTPGELVLNVKAAAKKPSVELKNKVLSISRREDIGTLREPPEEGALFSVSYDSRDGQAIAHLGEQVARLLSLLRDA
jgi:hypothetical protein